MSVVCVYSRYPLVRLAPQVALLHGIVGALLLGIVVLVVGLVQLSPGAEAAQHRYYLMGAGAALTGGGVLAAVLRYLPTPSRYIPFPVSSYFTLL